MRKALGTLILMFGFAYLFSKTFSALDDAGGQIARAIGTAAAVSEQQMLELK